MNAVNLPTSRRAMIAAWVYEALRSTFAHWEAVPNYDLEQEFAAYLDEALVAPDRLTFDLVILRFVAGLNNGHTAFSDNWLSAEHSAPIGFDAGSTDDGWVVAQSAVRGLEPGDWLTRIDGEPVEAFANAKLPLVAGPA